MEIIKFSKTEQYGWIMCKGMPWWRWELTHQDRLLILEIQSFPSEQWNFLLILHASNQW
jgi:hypothetical protein